MALFALFLTELQFPSIAALMPSATPSATILKIKEYLIVTK